MSGLRPGGLAVVAGDLCRLIRPDRVGRADGWIVNRLDDVKVPTFASGWQVHPAVVGGDRGERGRVPRPAPQAPPPPPQRQGGGGRGGRK